ncbi:hypothetical protein ABZZ44_09095 [Streptomyces sp. NPDC006460]|uniref:hypothetical protein n=1 Tax=Streptomyces sp. NPDC006460 TaxID=3154304 RepID=UPI0033AB759D
MNNPPPPRLKSHTPTLYRPGAAEQARHLTVVGAPKGVAEGVPTAVRLDLQPTSDSPGIRIYAPPVYRHHDDGARWSTRPGDTPAAAYACACGQTGTATGPNTVAALVAEYTAHKTACPEAHVPAREERNAA